MLSLTVWTMGWMAIAWICVPLSGLLLTLPGKTWTALQVPLHATVMRSPITPPSLPTTGAPVPTPAVMSPTTYPTFNSQQFDQQLQRYLYYFALNGPPDVLIVGSSRAAQGVDPVTLQETLHNRGYQDVKVFNFGINGATVQVVELLLTRLLTAAQLPRMIVWADGSRAFNSGRTDLTYQKLVKSPGYRLLASGVRPPMPQTQVPQVGQVGQLCMNMPFKPATGNTTKNAKPGTGVPGLQSIPLQLCSQPTATTQPLTITPLPDTLGFRAVATQFNPATYFRRYPRVPGNADADYRNFSLRGSQTQSFQRLLRFASEQQVPIVFVYLPLTQTYLDGTRSGYEQQFCRFMQRYARTNQIALYDFNQRSLSHNQYFADPSHLNQYGAAAIASQIGRFLLIPGVQPSTSVR